MAVRLFQVKADGRCLENTPAFQIGSVPFHDHGPVGGLFLARRSAFAVGVDQLEPPLEVAFGTLPFQPAAN